MSTTGSRVIIFILRVRDHHINVGRGILSATSKK
jgi:hypothetical protein